MKKLRLVPVFIAILFIALILDSCKYEEGPSISFRSRKERVANTWAMDKYTVNSYDSTLGFNLLYPQARWTFNKNGGFMYTFNIADSAIIANGEWEFTSNDDAINLSYATLADTIKKQTVTILRLKEKEFWFKRTDIDTINNVATPITREFHLKGAN